MPRLIRCAGLFFLVLAFLVPTLPAQDKKADDSKKGTDKSGGSTQEPKAKPKERPALDWSGDFGGKLTAFDEKEEGRLIFTVQVSYKYPEFNADAQRQIVQHQQTYVQQQGQLARAKTAQERQNILNQMANTVRQIEQQQAQLYKAKDVNFDVKCQAADNMRVRRFAPTEQIDPETGEFIKMTKELVLELKGHEGYPGYKSDTKILRTGQLVQVFVAKGGNTPAAMLDKAKKAGAKVDDMQQELKNFRYDVIMIYVVVDAPKNKT